jgi:phage protein D
MIGPVALKAEVIFKGEVVGIEPVFDSGSESRVTLRAFNKLHRLTRGRKSRTYEKMTDSDMVSRIAGDHSLSPNSKGDVKITYDHVYQHNQTDLEFLLQRAARIDYEIFVDDTNLHFRKRDVSVDSGIELTLDAKARNQLLKFNPRLSTAGMVQEVNVRGWDHVKKEEVLGTATAPAKELGGTSGPTAANRPFGSRKHHDVDVPVTGIQEANAMAKARFEELSLNFITGDAVCVGNPRLKAGIVVKIKVEDSRFDGKYYIVGCAHRYVHENKGGGKGGYLTSLKVRRNAET